MKRGKVIVRHASMDTDALGIVEGAREFSVRMGLERLFPQEGGKFVAAIGRVLTLDGVMILVAEHEKKIVGGIGMIFSPYVWNEDITVADELFWWAAKDAPIRASMALFNRAMEEIDEREAMPMFRALSNSTSGVDRAYRRAGLVPVETSYMRPL